MPDRQPENVTATEIASWVYCPESWRLNHIGHQPGNVPVMEAGREYHAGLVDAHLAAGRSPNRLAMLGYALVILAALALAWGIIR